MTATHKILSKRCWFRQASSPTQHSTSIGKRAFGAAALLRAGCYMQHYQPPTNMKLHTQCGTLPQIRGICPSQLMALSLHVTRAPPLPLHSCCGRLCIRITPTRDACCSQQNETGFCTRHSGYSAHTALHTETFIHTRETIQAANKVPHALASPSEKTHSLQRLKAPSCFKNGSTPNCIHMHKAISHNRPHNEQPTQQQCSTGRAKPHYQVRVNVHYKAYTWTNQTFTCSH